MLCLEGTVVLDLTRRYPGAFCSMLLADFGAEVIKVDPPGATLPNPDPDAPADRIAAYSLTRAKGGVPEERFAAYHAFDRNKRSIVVDLKNESGRDVFARMVKRADVLFEGFRPGVMDRLGLGYSQLSALNPRLVYCALTGFGSTDGPYANLPAHDMNYIAFGGALSMIGQRDGQPYFPSNLIADMGGAAMHGTLGALLALLAREKSGLGQFVDISFLDSVISLLTPLISKYFESGVVPKRGTDPSTGSEPWAQVFRCKDGEYYAIGAGEEKFWANLCRALGREDLIPEHHAKGERADKVIAELAAIFETRTRDEWHEYLKDKDTCVSPVWNLDEALRDPQVLHRGMVIECEHPKLGKVRQPGVAIKLSGTPGGIRHVGVPTDTDREAILGELGYSAAEIVQLRDKGALG